MNRRGFVKACAGSAALALANWDSLVLAGTIEAFPPAKLTNQAGAPLKAAEVPTGEALVFSYPLAGVPCFLINLGNRSAAPRPKLAGERGEEYDWAGGVGPNNRIVAFIAICTHQMSFPQQNISYMRYAASGSELAGVPGRIVCCAHASVFDPAEGGRPVSGPTSIPLLPVRLRHDPASDELTADGILGMDLINRFFKIYKRDLIARFGPGGYLQPIEGKTAAIPLSQYSAAVPAC